MNKTYIQINNVLYPTIEIAGRMNDPEWDNRHTKTIHLEDISYEQAIELFVDGTEWNIVCDWDEQLYDSNGNPEGDPILHRDIFDNTEFVLAGPVTDWRDGTISVKMGQLTDLEEAYELLYGE